MKILLISVILLFSTALATADDTSPEAKDNTNIVEDDSNIMLQILNSLKQLQIENEKLTENVGNLQAEIDDLKENQMVESRELRFGDSLPVGSIIAWVGSNITGSYLPEGWQLCDGSYITKGPMINMRTPELNSEGRYLRGSEETSSGGQDIWMYQQQMMMSHSHSVEDRGHSHDDRGHKHYIGESYYDGTNTGYNSVWYQYMGSVGNKPLKTNYAYADISKEKTGIELGRVTGVYYGDVGNEVRPKSMLVQWIIKIL